MPVFRCSEFVASSLVLPSNHVAATMLLMRVVISIQSCKLPPFIVPPCLLPDPVQNVAQIPCAAAEPREPFRDVPQAFMDKAFGSAEPLRRPREVCQHQAPLVRCVFVAAWPVCICAKSKQDWAEYVFVLGRQYLQ